MKSKTAILAALVVLIVSGHPWAASAVALVAYTLIDDESSTDSKKVH